MAGGWTRRCERSLPTLMIQPFLGAKVLRLLKRPQRGRAPPVRTHHGSDRARRAARRAQTRHGRPHVRVGGRGGAEGGGSGRAARRENMAAVEAAARRVSRQEQELCRLVAEVGRLKERDASCCAEGCSPELLRLRAENEKLRYRLLHLRRSLEAELARAAPAEPRAGSEVTALGRGGGRAPCGAGWERYGRPGHGCGLGAAPLPALRELRDRGIVVSNHRSLFLPLTGPCERVGILVTVVIEITLRKRYREAWSALLQSLLSAVLRPGSGFR